MSEGVRSGRLVFWPDPTTSCPGAGTVIDKSAWYLSIVGGNVARVTLTRIPGRPPGGTRCGSGSCRDCSPRRRSVSASPSTICAARSEAMPTACSEPDNYWGTRTAKSRNEFIGASRKSCGHCADETRKDEFYGTTANLWHRHFFGARLEARKNLNQLGKLVGRVATEFSFQLFVFTDLT